MAGFLSRADDMTAYYNEMDPYAAQWLRNLIEAGHIAFGVVDERSIEDVRPDELAGYTQCHFFAGIGVWSYALRLAGWPDDEPVWTGSCPCQPFSQAGKGKGFADERHLWPAWDWLISECRPSVILGEQVASKDIDPWIDLVQADLEAMGYAIGCVPFPSAGVGAPHIRDRAYFMAYANNARSQGRKRMRERAAERSAGARGVAGIVADPDSCGRSPRREGCTPVGYGQTAQSDSCIGRLANAAGAGRGERSADSLRSGERGVAQGLEQRTGDVRFLGRDEPAGPTNGFWRDADWLSCRDGKWRPVEPGTFPLVDGAASRVGRLRAYGNAINAESAKVFITSVMDVLCEA